MYEMTSDLDTWQAGSPWHYLGQGRMPRWVKIPGHGRKNVAEVVGATSSESFLVTVSVDSCIRHENLNTLFTRHALWRIQESEVGDD